MPPKVVGESAEQEEFVTNDGPPAIRRAQGVLAARIFPRKSRPRRRRSGSPTDRRGIQRDHDNERATCANHFLKLRGAGQTAGIATTLSNR